MKSACSRYRLHIFASYGIYILAVAVISGWFGWEPPKAGLGLYLTAIFPALPIGATIFAMGRYIVEEPDEFERMLQVKAMLIATGLTMFACTAWGFLAQYAHIRVLPLYLVFPMWLVCWALAKPVINRSYR